MPKEHKLISVSSSGELSAQQRVILKLDELSEQGWEAVSINSNSYGQLLVLVARDTKLRNLE